MMYLKPLSWPLFIVIVNGYRYRRYCLHITVTFKKCTFELWHNFYCESANARKYSSSALLEVVEYNTENSLRLAYPNPWHDLSPFLSCMSSSEILRTSLKLDSRWTQDRSFISHFVHCSVLGPADTLVFGLYGSEPSRERSSGIWFSLASGLLLLSCTPHTLLAHSLFSSVRIRPRTYMVYQCFLLSLPTLWVLFHPCPTERFT